MRQWFHDRPWIWVVVLLVFVVSGGIVTLIIAEFNRPMIVKEKTSSLVVPGEQAEDYDRVWLT